MTPVGTPPALTPDWRTTMNAVQTQLVADFTRMVAKETQQLADFDAVTSVTAWPCKVRHGNGFWVRRDGDKLVMAPLTHATHFSRRDALAVAKLFGKGSRALTHREALVETLEETKANLEVLHREFAA